MARFDSGVVFFLGMAFPWSDLAVGCGCVFARCASAREDTPSDTNTRIAKVCARMGRERLVAQSVPVV